jgi:glycosyltransferase involved in cell wall biosynthesis
LARSARVALVMGQTAGGIGRHVSSLVPELIARGAEVRVIAPGSARRFANEDFGSRFIDLEIPRGMSVASNWAALRRLRRELTGTDVVHAHGIRAGVLSSFATKAARVPHLVVTMHGEVLEQKRGFKLTARILDWASARRADRSIFVSRALANSSSRRRRRSGRLMVLPAGADLSSPVEAEVSRARESLELGTETLAIVAVGRLHPLKGFDVLIDAAGRLRKGNFKLVIAGEGPERSHLETLIDSLEVAPHVSLLGERDDARALIAAADVFCLPSLTEGSPLAVQEAMAFGVPIVTTSAEGILETMGGGDAALVVSPGDPIALADALDLMLSDADLRKTMQDKARSAARSLLDSTEVARRIADIYEELLGRELGTESRETK